MTGRVRDHVQVGQGCQKMVTGISFPAGRVTSASHGTSGQISLPSFFAEVTQSD